MVLYRLTREGNRLSQQRSKTNPHGARTEECPGCLINYSGSRGIQRSHGWDAGKIFKGESGGGWVAMAEKNRFDQISTFIGSSDIGAGSNTPEAIAELRDKFAKEEGFRVTVQDNYDFSGKYSDKLEEFSAAVAVQLNPENPAFKEKPPYEIVRALAQWRHMSGYNGYPVTLTIDVTPAEIREFKNAHGVRLASDARRAAYSRIA